MTIAERQGMSEDKNFDAKPTQSKTNFSSCLGVWSYILMEDCFMELKGKALYNLLKTNALDSPQSFVASSPKEWQLEDLRALPDTALLERLKQLKLNFDKSSFLLYAEEADSPEDLIDLVWVDEDDDEGHDRAYLVLFELWRRLLPHKQCLSIFCDQLDFLIDAYDRAILEDDEPLEDALCTLEDILDDACDEQGVSPQEVFDEISLYCAHDVESFLYDYILAQIEGEDDLYASELIDSFYEYISDKKWFDFLRARLFFSTHSEESNILIERLLEQLKEEPDVDLMLQIVDGLVHYGDIRLFPYAVKQALSLLKTEKDFRKLLTMSAEYYRCLDKEKEEKEISSLLEKRSHFSESHPFNSSDKSVAAFYELL